MTIHDYGFYRLAAVVPPCTVGDCATNAEHIISLLQKSAEMGADLAVFPALALTSASCGDLYAEGAAPCRRGTARFYCATNGVTTDCWYCRSPGLC